MLKFHVGAQSSEPCQDYLLGCDTDQFHTFSVASEIRNRELHFSKMKASLLLIQQVVEQPRSFHIAKETINREKIKEPTEWIKYLGTISLAKY